MQFLHDNGYKVIDLSEAVRLIMSSGSSLSPIPYALAPEASTLHPAPNTQHPGSSSLHPTPYTLPPEKFVVLTFDDGYLDFHSHAFPILRRYGFAATVFLPADHIDSLKPGLRGKQHLNWEEVHELAAQGITFGSHTCTHCLLRNLTMDEIKCELQKSKETIETHLNYLPNKTINQLTNHLHEPNRRNQPFSQLSNSLLTVDSFSYPYNFPEAENAFIEAFQEILSNVGYATCVTTRIGSVNDSGDKYCLKRVPGNSGDDQVLFAAKLAGHYDWLYVIQFVKKWFRNIVLKQTRSKRSGMLMQ